MNKSIDNFDELIDKPEKKKIFVDYGGANVAKTLHVGHMRPANIGESLKRLAKLLGNDTIGDVHLGDLGRQSGMVISEIKKRKPDLCYFDPNYKGEYPKLEITEEELSEYYPTASQAAKEDEERMEEVRKITAYVDEGKEPYFSMWKDIVEVSTKAIKRTYDFLNCDFELWEGELSSLEYIDDTLKVLEPYMYESQGAKVIDVQKEDDKVEIPPLIVIKNDGASIYATRDLASLYSRVNKYDPDEIWYVVDMRQSLYFEQVFRAAYKSKMVREDAKLYHYWFGTMNGKDGKPFKTRDGGVMSLDNLISEVKSKLEDKLSDNVTNKEETLNILTSATIKFADLLPFRTTDYIFDIEKFSSFEGKTGPYILYTVVRIKSILNKTNIDNAKLSLIPNGDSKDILLKIIELPKVLKSAYNEATPSYIAEYIYDLCNIFNKFYNNHNILNEEDNNVKESYIALCNLTYNILHNLLNILAIEEVDKM
jgi:arginyl-tRNA synthetase